MKYTILPPQKGPNLPTVFRRPRSLGEHQAAFLNANNRFGFQVDELPEEPVVEEVAAMWLTVVNNLPKVSKDERQREAAKHRVKMLNAGYKMRGGVYVKVKTLTEEDYEHARQEKLKKAKEDKQKRFTPVVLQEYRKALRDPKWQKPWEHEAYHEEHRRKVEAYAVANPDHPGVFRKHIVATRTHFSYQATPLRGDEYRTRLDKLLSDLEQQSNIQNPTLRKMVAMEKADRILKEQLSQFTPTFNIDEFLNPSEPKSDPTGQHRINPYL